MKAPVMGRLVALGLTYVADTETNQVAKLILAHGTFLTVQQVFSMNQVVMHKVVALGMELLVMDNIIHHAQVVLALEIYAVEIMQLVIAVEPMELSVRGQLAAQI